MIAQRVKQARKLRKMTQQDLADRAEIALSSVERVESGAGMPRADSLVRIGDALGVSADFILGRMDRTSCLVPGWYLVDMEFVQKLLGTTDPKEIDQLCEDHSGAEVDIGMILPEGVDALDPDKGRDLTLQVVGHIAAHGPRSLRKIYRRHEAEERGD